MQSYQEMMIEQFPAESSSFDPEDTCDKFGKYLLQTKQRYRHEESSNSLDVPDYLKCAITDELMIEPVLIESGHTYEKAMILEHFKKSGAIDPITGQEVNPQVIVPNHALKKASKDFLAQNPWAYQHIINEDYRNIAM